MPPTMTKPGAVEPPEATRSAIPPTRATTQTKMPCTHHGQFRHDATTDPRATDTTKGQAVIAKPARSRDSAWLARPMTAKTATRTISRTRLPRMRMRRP